MSENVQRGRDGELRRIGYLMFSKYMSTDFFVENSILEQMALVSRHLSILEGDDKRL